MITVNQLKAIYPTLKVNQIPEHNEADLTVMVDEQWLSIPKAILSTSEQALLLSLACTVDNENRPWYSFLWGQKNQVPTKREISVRILQFQVTFTDSPSQKAAWLEAFQAYFVKPIDAFWLDEATGILIERQSDDSFETNFTGILQSLDAMFYTKTVFYIGHFWPVSGELPTLFQMEHQLFKQAQRSSVNTLAPSLFQSLIQQDRLYTPLIAALKTSLPTDSETLQMINTFFKYHGKLSQAAKALFIHRNTLVYRIDKFYKLTGFDLRNNYDLTLCHLIMN